MVPPPDDPTCNIGCNGTPVSGIYQPLNTLSEISEILSLLSENLIGSCPALEHALIFWGVLDSGISTQLMGRVGGHFLVQSFTRPASDCFAFLCKSRPDQPPIQPDICWYIMVKFNIGNVRTRKSSNFAKLKTFWSNSKCKRNGGDFGVSWQGSVCGQQFLRYLSQIWETRLGIALN